MKKLIFILTLCVATSAFAQNSFPTSNAIWNYTVSAEDYYGNRGERNVYYTIYGNTIVNDYTYNKLYTTFDTIMCGDNLGEFIGGFRQDGQKVYFRPNNGEEFLLYDFGVSVGDTISIDYNFRYYFWRHNNYKAGYHDFMDYMSKTFIISNIEIENEIKKIYLHATDGYDDVWYEGIGSPYGFFNAGEIKINDGYSFEFSLNCLKHNNTVKYLNNLECNKCFCKNYIDIKEETIDTEAMNIFPNPTKNILNIETSENIEIKSINIYNIDGKFIEKNRYNYFGKVEFNVRNLKAGSYILNIETSKGNFNQIIIKN
jgi:hypothetical protein